jgi:hypothetical protein
MTAKLDPATRMRLTEELAALESLLAGGTVGGVRLGDPGITAAGVRAGIDQVSDLLYGRKAG